MPFWIINTIKITLTNNGIETKAINIKIIPVRKSIHPAKSFGNPKKDLIKTINPKIIKICEGISVKILKANALPAATSIAPKILTSIFFKLRYHLKNYQA